MKHNKYYKKSDICFPLLEIFICFPRLYLFSYRKFNLFSMQCHLYGNRYLFSNLLCHLLEILICFPMITSSTGTGKQMIVRKPFFLEILICFPIFREKTISWKEETDILGRQPPRLLLKWRSLTGLIHGKLKIERQRSSLQRDYRKWMSSGLYVHDQTYFDQKCSWINLGN